MEPPWPKRQKREKVTVACDQCRSRKVKCDGKEPVCATCQRRSGDGTACTWHTGPLHARAPTSPIRLWSFDQNTSQLERGNSTSQSSSSSIGMSPTAGAQGASAGASGPCFRDVHRPRPGSPNPTVLGTGVSLDPNILDRSVTSKSGPTPQGASGLQYDESFSSIPSNEAIMGASVDANQERPYFGSSSAGNFMQNARTMVEQNVSRSQQRMRSDANGYIEDTPAPVPKLACKQKHVKYVLPPRQTADNLMALYWRYVHVLYPFLDKAQFQNDYDKVWRGDGSISEERLFVCVLSTIFALSCRVDESVEPEHRAAAAHVYYLRAEELLNVVATGSIRSVQSILLLGQYFQSTSEPYPCWVSVGLAEPWPASSKNERAPIQHPH